MTKYSYTSDEDKKLIDQSFNNIAWLVFGKKSSNKIKAFRNLFEERVKEVNIFPQGTTTEYLNDVTPGICRSDKKDNRIVIEMWGYGKSNSSQHSFIKHEGTHEFCHSFADLLPKATSKQSNGVIKDGVKCENSMGLIKETDPISGKLVGQHFYGKMFNETMMDIITSMSINAFDSSNGKPVDDILEKQHSQWSSSKTDYSIFTSITRLTIAAFSNNGFANYQNIVDAGIGIFDINTKMDNGETYKANDFLYGILFDPLHIDHEFDKFMGKGSYKILCEYLDRLFMSCLDSQKVPSEEVKRLMNILPNFLNKKMNYYIENGIINQDGANQIIGKFNKIWNSMQVEYQSFFSQSDIDKIAEKAGSGNNRK